METTQRVVRRNGLLSRLLTVLVGVAAALLAYAVVHGNLSSAARQAWPDLLDVQSATAALLATAGAALARAQYARTVRPALGYDARVVGDAAPGGHSAWVVHLTNAAQDVAVVVATAYRVELAGPDAPTPAWTDAHRARAAIESRGLVRGTDYYLEVLGPGAPLVAPNRSPICWLTEQALAQVAEIYVKIRVVDRVGDEHERTIRCLKAAERNLRFGAR